MRDFLMLLLIGLVIYVWLKEVKGQQLAALPQQGNNLYGYGKAHNKEEWQIVRDDEGRLDKVIISREIVFE